MSEPVRCFMVHETGDVLAALRRFTFRDRNPCPANDGYYGHDAAVEIGAVPARQSVEGFLELIPVEEYADDDRWPTTCDLCGYVFVDDDHRQVAVHRLYRDESGQVWPLRKLPPGAMFEMSWAVGEPGPDGKHLAVVLPDGHSWRIDSIANNCDRRDEPHKCWVRIGEPPDLTVGKGAPGESCTAGQGSVQSPGGHWFLRKGAIVDA